MMSCNNYWKMEGQKMAETKEREKAVKKKQKDDEKKRQKR